MEQPRDSDLSNVNSPALTVRSSLSCLQYLIQVGTRWLTIQISEIDLVFRNLKMSTFRRTLSGDSPLRANILRWDFYVKVPLIVYVVAMPVDPNCYIILVLPHFKLQVL